jgi:hypothetical protein
MSALRGQFVLKLGLFCQGDELYSYIKDVTGNSLIKKKGIIYSEHEILK